MLDFFRAVPKKRKVKIRSNNGIIFNNPPTWRKTIFHFGSGSLLVALMFLGYLYFPLIKAVVVVKSQSGKVEEITKKIETTKPVDTGYFLQIPKILARAEVITGVSPFKTAEYMAVLDKNQVAQTKNSDLPGGGKGKTTYIFAHSTNSGVGMIRKNAVFYLLGDLTNGDLIFLERNGEVFKYRMIKRLIVGANQVEYLNYKEDDRELLILQTCWPIGTDWKRLLVLAERE